MRGVGAAPRIQNQSGVFLSILTFTDYCCSSTLQHKQHDIERHSSVENKLCSQSASKPTKSRHHFPRANDDETSLEM